MNVDSSRASPQITDGLHNYELKDQLALGAASLVFRAICKRGRMRNRLVVVKKFLPPCKHRNDTSRVARDPVLAAALHSTLCHPTIVTLLSSFSAPTGFYQVLEFCENGSLSGFLHARDPHTLAEEELRGVARALADALVYLKKERVLHRDIKPSNVLITGDFRLKLSGFGFAVRLPRSDSTETAFCGSPNYVSPEILSGSPYRFPTDLWSVGSVLLTCLTGQPAFNASTPEEVFENICCARYNLPGGSYEVQDLIAGMLQKEPEDRSPLHRVLSHPFFKPTLPVRPLSAGVIDPGRSEDTGIAPSSDSIYRGPPLQRYPPLLSRDAERVGPTFPCKQHLVSKRTPLDDITNFYQDASRNDLASSPRRTTSAPTISWPAAVTGEDSRPATPGLTVDSGTPSVSSLGGLAEERNTGLRPSLQEKSFHEMASPRTQLKRVLSEPCGSTRRRSDTPVPDFNQLVLPIPARTAMHIHRVSSQATSSTAVSKSTNVSADLRKISTRRLKPQTHKLSRGQLVVLPSKALLVDFRESERRKGHEGKQVLVITPDGDTVEVYDAPHLSTPCCLVEPVAVYASRQLPTKHLKQYEDAMQIVDQLNARIPKLIHFADDAKCTLMANGPPGDIEIRVPAEDTEADDKEAMRLRLQRSKHTLEISRHIKNAAASARKDVGEWTKKVIPLSHSLKLSEDEHRSLDGLEQLAVGRLGEFLVVCEAAEAVEGSGRPHMDKHDGDGRKRLERSLRHMERTSKDKGSELEDRPRARALSENGSRGSGVSFMVVPPRPRKFSSTVMLR